MSSPVESSLAENPLKIENVSVALLAGGLATRLRPITQTIPKALVDVGGRPFIDHQLELLARNGIRHVVFCLGYLGEQVEAHVGDGRRFGVCVEYSFDGPTLQGTGGALRRALPLLGDTFWVMYGDSYMDIAYREVLAAFATAREAGSEIEGLMTVLHNGDRWDKSNVVFRDGCLQCYDKRNKTPEMAYIDYGVSILRRNAVERIRLDQPFDLADLYRDLTAEHRMIGFEVRERFYEIGTPESLQEASDYLARRAA